MRYDLQSSVTFDEVVIQRGLEAYNRAYGLDPIVELTAIFHDDAGEVRGGIYGELNWDWLYVDLLWVDRTLRERGVGARLLASLERAAYGRGARHSYLATTSFQALPFYYRAGYRVFGVLEDRPPGYNYYYIQKALVEPSQEDDIPVSEDPDPDDFLIVRRGLAAHNQAHRVNYTAQRLVIFLRAEDNRVVGGLIGATYWGWLDIQAFWVEKWVRGRGHGSHVLALAESEALKRGCHQVFVDVAEFQSLGFFQKRDYTTFATLGGRPAHHNTHFMHKPLYIPPTERADW